MDTKTLIRKVAIVVAMCLGCIVVLWMMPGVKDDSSLRHAATVHRATAYLAGNADSGVVANADRTELWITAGTTCWLVKTDGNRTVRSATETPQDPCGPTLTAGR